MRRKLLQFPSLLGQHALRGAPKPQLQPHHHRLLHSPTAPPSLSPSPSAELLWNLAGGTVASLLPKSAAAVAAAAAARTAANRWLAATRGAGSLDLFSLQRRGRTGGSVWQFVSSTFIAPWAYWLRMPPDGMVLTLIGANVTVFMLWRVADQGFMRRHFTNSLDNFKSGRLHTLLTSAFSHIGTGHLFSSMFGLYFFGTNIANVFGPAFLLKLYVAGAITGSAFFLLEKAFLAPGKQGYVGWDSSRAPGLGASAAVNAVILLDIFLNPKALVYLYFFIPVPAALLGAFLIGTDLYRVNKGQSHGSALAQLGGAVVAALVWPRIRKGRI